MLPTDPVDSEAMVGSLLVAESARLAVQRRIIELKGGMTIEHALLRSPSAHRNTSTTPFTSHFSSLLLQAELTPHYSESALMKGIIVKKKLQQQQSRSVPPWPLSSNSLPRSTLLSVPSTPIVPPEDTLDTVRERHRLVTTSVSRVRLRVLDAERRWGAQVSHFRQSYSRCFGRLKPRASRIPSLSYLTKNPSCFIYPKNLLKKSCPHISVPIGCPPFRSSCTCMDSREPKVAKTTELYFTTFSKGTIKGGGKD